VTGTTEIGSSRTSALTGTAVATAAILASGVITGLVAARSLGPDGRGQLATVTVWAGTFLYAGTFGLPDAVSYFSAREPASSDRAWATGQVLAAGLAVLVMFAGWWLIPLILSGQNAPLIGIVRWFLCLYAIPALGSLCACGWLQGRGAIRAFNISRSAVHIVNAAGMLALLVFGIGSVASFAAVALVGNAVTWLLASQSGLMMRVIQPVVSRPLARQMLSYGARVQFGSWSSMANMRLDQLLLSIWAPAAALGLYVVAVSYASLLQTIPGSAALVMFPEIVRASDGAARDCLLTWYRRVLWTTVAAAIRRIVGRDSGTQ